MNASCTTGILHTATSNDDQIISRLMFSWSLWTLTASNTTDGINFNSKWFQIINTNDDFSNKSMALGEEVFPSNSIVWHMITYQCPRYLRLALESTYIRPRKRSAHLLSIYLIQVRNYLSYRGSYQAVSNQNTDPISNSYFACVGTIWGNQIKCRKLTFHKSIK